MSIKDQLQMMDEVLVKKIFFLSAYMMNDADLLNRICEDMGLSRSEGLALIQVITEIGLNEETKVKTEKQLKDLQKEIECSLS